MDTFRHAPLDHSKECIRLLRFVDQPPSSQHDYFTLETYDIATAPRFAALSYTWGSPKPTYNIIIDKLLFSIGENLLVALKALRSFFPKKASALEISRRWEYVGRTPPKDLLQENGYPLLWVDAICINQSDPSEKNHQVNMMGRIYSTAERVISWLGDEADNSSSVMKAIRATTHTPYYTPNIKQDTVWFANRPYWRRMWVIQEFVLPQDLIILCGLEGVWWEDLFHFWNDEKLLCDTYGDGQLSYWDIPRFKGKSAKWVSKGALSALIFARHSRRGGSLSISSSDIMARFAYGECSDRRDRIYALLTLIEPEPGVKPLLADYTISSEDLYYRVLGYIGPLKYGNFRKKLGEALGSRYWAGSEQAKLNEEVYSIVERLGYKGQRFRPSWGTDWKIIHSFRHYGCLACSLGSPGFMQFERRRTYNEIMRQYQAFSRGEGPETRQCYPRLPEGMRFERKRMYDEIIRQFQAFPRGEDPETWQRFENLLHRWLQSPPDHWL